MKTNFHGELKLERNVERVYGFMRKRKIEMEIKMEFNSVKTFVYTSEFYFIHNHLSSLKLTNGRIRLKYYSIELFIK